MPTEHNTYSAEERLQDKDAEARWVANMLPEVVKVFDTARHQLEHNIAAVDLLSTADAFLALSQFDDDNALEHNGTMWHSGLMLAESGDRGVRAIGVLLQVSALAAHPDLCAVMLTRLHDRLGAALLDV